MRQVPSHQLGRVALVEAPSKRAVCMCFRLALARPFSTSKRAWLPQNAMHLEWAEIRPLGTKEARDKEPRY